MGKAWTALNSAAISRLAVPVAGIGHRKLAQELAGVAVVVLRVDPEEGHALTELLGLGLEVGELRTAGSAPRSPFVHYHGVATQLADALLEGVRAAAQELVGLLVQGGQRRGRALQRAGTRARRRSPGCPSRSPPSPGRTGLVRRTVAWSQPRRAKSPLLWCNGWRRRGPGYGSGGRRSLDSGRRSKAGGFLAEATAQLHRIAAASARLSENEGLTWLTPLPWSSPRRFPART